MFSEASGVEKVEKSENSFIMKNHFANKRRKEEKNWIFILFLPRKLRTECYVQYSLMTFNEMRKVLHSQHIFIPLKRALKIFPTWCSTAAMLRQCCDVEHGCVGVCDKGVVFCVFLMRREMDGGQGTTEGKKETFLGTKVKRLWVESIASRFNNNLIRTQNTKFIKTTKNFTIEQHAFIVNFFFAFTLLACSLKFSHKRNFLLLSPRLFPPHETNSRWIFLF